MAMQIPAISPSRLSELDASYRSAVADRRRRTLFGFGLLAVVIVASGWVGEVNVPAVFENGSRFFSYIGRIFTLDSGQFVLTDPVEWYWGLGRWLRLIGETVVIAYLATIFGGIAAFILSFLAARNLTHNASVRFVARRFLEFCRTVPEIVYAMIFVVALGLGPLPGVLALTIHTTGALGKLFFEVLENADDKPLEGMVSTGANWFTSLRFAILPQVISNFTSYALLRFEINVREGAIMGAVGAGGIGQDLLEAIRKFYYPDVSAMLVLLIITVSLIDYGTEKIRYRLINMEGGR
jgi:phosphonate transport system permease protein